MLSSDVCRGLAGPLDRCMTADTVQLAISVVMACRARPSSPDEDKRPGIIRLANATEKLLKADPSVDESMWAIVRTTLRCDRTASCNPSAGSSASQQICSG